MSIICKLIRNKHCNITFSIAIALMHIPNIILAFNPGGVPNAAPNLTVSSIIDIIFSILWPVFVAFAVVMFIVASFKFFTAGGDIKEIEDARNFVVWGVVGIMVALLAFSIPFIVRNTIGQGI